MASRTAVRFGQHIKELRLHLCQKSKESQGVREFIEKHYVDIKTGNPKFPILIRECSGIQPKAFARYEFGKETSVPLTGLSSQDILQTVERLATKPTV